MMVWTLGALHRQMLLQLMWSHDLYTSNQWTRDRWSILSCCCFLSLCNCLAYFWNSATSGGKTLVHTEMNIFSPAVPVNLNRHLSRCQSNKLALIRSVTLDLFRDLQHGGAEKQRRLKVSSWLLGVQNFQKNLLNSAWDSQVVREPFKPPSCSVEMQCVKYSV